MSVLSAGHPPHSGRVAPAESRTGARSGGSRHSSDLYESLRVSRGKQRAYDLKLLLREWDRGSKHLRSRILHDFVHHHRESTGPQLEAELGNGASLFLTPVSAWLRLTYLLGTCLSLQLQALHIFVAASSGQRFLAEFLEVGGGLTILEILGLEQVAEGDKIEAVQLLAAIATSGRKFKELVCESRGLERAGQCLTLARTEALEDATRNLLVQLGMGNIKYQDQVRTVLSGLLVSDSAGAQRMAAQALRTLLPSMVEPQIGLNEAALFLLRSPKLEVQYEGSELVKELIKTPQNSRQLLVGLISSLKPSVDDLDMGSADEQAADVAGYSNVSHAYTQQAAAAKLLGMIAAVEPELLGTMLELQVVHGLLVALATTAYLDSQKKAAGTLLFLISKNHSIETRLVQDLGRQFVDTILNNPNSFYRNLTTIQLESLANNNVRFANDTLTDDMDDYSHDCGLRTESGLNFLQLGDDRGPSSGTPSG